MNEAMDGAQLLDWLLKGGLVLLGTGLAWVIREIISMRKAARDSAETVAATVWQRSRQTMTEYVDRIGALEKAREESEQERFDEREECAKKIEAVREEMKTDMRKREAQWQEEFDKISGKYRDVLRLCADQEEEIQHSRIVIAKIEQRRGPVKTTTTPMLGGRRSYDPPPPPGTVTVTVAPGAAASVSQENAHKNDGGTREKA